MNTVLVLGLVSLFTDISSEMVYPLISLYLTTGLRLPAHDKETRAPLSDLEKRRTNLPCQ